MSSTACWPWPSPTCCAARPTTPACTCRSASCWPSWPASRKPCCSTTTAAKAAPGLGACSPTWTPPNSAWPTCSTFTATHRPADHAHTGELGNTPTPPAHTVLPAETPSTINEGRKLTLASGPGGGTRRKGASTMTTTGSSTCGPADGAAATSTVNLNELEPDQLTEYLAGWFAQTATEEQRRLLGHVLRELASGQPVEPARLAALSRLPVDRVEGSL